MALTHKQQAFISAYLQCFNAAEAARQAGCKDGPGIWQAAHRLLTNSEVSRAISERLSTQAMSAEECLARLAEQARGNIEDFIELIPGGVDRDKWVNELVRKLDVATAAAKRGEEVDYSPIAEHLAHEPKQPGWRINLEKAQERGVLNVAHRIGYDKFGRPEVELESRQGALQLIGKAHKLFVDRQELTGKDGADLMAGVAGALETKLADLATRLAAEAASGAASGAAQEPPAGSD